MGNEFLDKSKNDSFAFLRGLDLREMLNETEKFFLKYRDHLGLPDDVTFGTEIEYEGVSKEMVDKFVMKNIRTWYSGSDGSLNSGGEVSSPVLQDRKLDWMELKKICNYLLGKKANMQSLAGGHIHVGTPTIGGDIESWRQFLKLYIAYENVLFRFLYGDKINGREKISHYARARAETLKDCLEGINAASDMYDIKRLLNTGERYLALNFLNTDFDYPQNRFCKNTIEFRSPNATSQAVIWQNNINTLTKMLLSARKKVMNEDFLDYKLDQDFKPFRGNEYLYDEINLKNALEFVDLVFDNNLDKVYFLRQYLKNFQDNGGLKKTVMAKRFVR